MLYMCHVHVIVYANKDDYYNYNKQGSKDARVRKVVLLTLSLIKSHKYSGAVLLTALCVKSKI